MSDALDSNQLTQKLAKFIDLRLSLKFVGELKQFCEAAGLKTGADLNRLDDQNNAFLATGTEVAGFYENILRLLDLEAMDDGVDLLAKLDELQAEMKIRVDATISRVEKTVDSLDLETNRDDFYQLFSGNSFLIPKLRVNFLDRKGAQQ